MMILICSMLVYLTHLFHFSDLIYKILLKQFFDLLEDYFLNQFQRASQQVTH